MITESEKKMVYKAFGYNIVSEIKLPELPERSRHEEIEDCIDIVIEKGDLTQVWNQLSETGNLFVVQKNLILFKVADHAIFSVEDGKKIVVSLYPGMDEDEIHLYLLGTCLGAILLQRKVIPLHGSAIAINGKAYAFVGHSGAGKSTLASAFINRGYKLLCDDLVAVCFKDGQIPYVTPSFPSQKLWEESLGQFGMESEQYVPLYHESERTKFSIPVSTNFSAEVLPLGGIFELAKTENESMVLYPVNGLKTLLLLYKHTFRSLFIKPMGIAEWHFKRSTDIVNQVPIYKLKRPLSSFTADELVTLILSTIN